MLADRFEILKTLGEGGMGVVYAARDSVRDMVVALKTLRRFDGEQLYHFKNEFRSHADLHHPNLCTLYELFETEGRWFFTMELVEGCDFGEWVRGPGSVPLAAGTPLPRGTRPPRTGDTGTVVGMASPLARMPVTPAGDGNTRMYDEAKLRDALAQVASGLAALHAAGKVHRDIKPGNILVTPTGRVVIMDFGLVADRELLAELASMRSIAGTPVFMAPEQGVPGASVGSAADWYAVGVMLFNALTGQWPYTGNTVGELLAAKQALPPAPAQLAPGVPDDLGALCTQLLSPDPASRPGSDAVLAATRGGEVPGWARRRDSSPRMADVFVGRRVELRALRAAFQGSRQRAAAVFVEGASGLGKSALVRRFLGELGDPAGRSESGPLHFRPAGRSESGPLHFRAVVLEGRCYAEEAVPYKAFDGIVDALTRHLVTLGAMRTAELLPPAAGLAVRLFPVLERVPGLELAEDVAAVGLELRARAFAALIEMLRRVAATAPLVLFVDDLQWADADSLLLMRELLHPDSAPPLLFLASVRTDASNAVEPHKFAPESLQRLELGRLAPDDAAELVAYLLPQDDGNTARREAIAKEAAGHPLFLAELAHHVQSGDGTSVAKLDDALWQRALALDADTRRVLELVAVAGLPIPARALADAAELSPTKCAPITAALRASRFITIAVTGGAEVVAPYHDRVRESLVMRMGRDGFAAASARLAGALMRGGVGDTQPELVARHLFAAGDSRRGADMAERAAARALAALAFDRAAELLRTALAAGPRDDAHARTLQLALADALASGGRGAEAADAFVAAGQGADRATQHDCRRRAADQLLASGHVARGLTELADVLAELGENIPETPTDALASMLEERAIFDPQIDALLSEPEPERESDPGSGSDSDSDSDHLLDIYQSASLGLILVDNVRGADFQARAVRLALAGDDLRRSVRALVFESIYRCQESEAGRARGAKILAHARALAADKPERPGQDPWLDAYLVFGDAFASYYAGKFKRAVELFKDADQRFRAFSGVAWEQNNAAIHRLRATDYQGAWGELRALYDEYLRDAERRDDRYVGASIKRWFNVLWLAQDRPDLAGADLDRSPWQPPDEGRYHLQHFLELRARVELALYRGDGARQGHWARPGLAAAEKSLLFRIQIARAIADWLLGRMAACEGNTREVDLRARRLADDRVNYGAIWSGLLQAAAIAQRHDKPGAIAQLEFTATYADDNEFPLCATFARLRAAQLEGPAGADKVNAELERLRAQDIRDPMKMAEVFAPGFGVR